MSEWISAETPPNEDEYSTDDGTVLVLLGGRWRRTGCYKHGSWHYHVGVFMLDVAWSPYNVTHWMPLPEPPKGD